jgi:uncharacterized protein YbjT (DUF2867 family)
MRVLLVGAAGLIGTAIAARLHELGHDVVAVVRRRGPASARLPAVEWVYLDLRRVTGPADWLPHLRSIDAVVNCAGVLQDSPQDGTKQVHIDAAGALFHACQAAGVRRVIQLSAIGIDRETPTDFSRTKLAGDQILMGLDLDWVILRPSVVVGRPAYGGSALFRGLAALPLLPVMPGTGLLQIVQLDDVVRTVERLLPPGAPAQIVLELVGPDRLTFEDVVRTYRHWLGWSPARHVRLPSMVAGAIFALGDMAGLLGWRPPIRSTARREILRGAIGDPSEWIRLTGIQPRSLSNALVADPSSVQERWFAKLYLLKPVILGVFSLFWIITGLISLGPGFDAGVRLMHEAGAGRLSAAGVVAGALADIAIGAGIAARRTSKAALYGALGLTLFYIIAGTMRVPALWADPLGAMLKIWPVFMLNIVALAILDER